jgi:hypothetical protein
MKQAVLQYTRQAVNDNKRYIDGNIADHLLENARSADTGYHYYLSDEEAEEFDTCDAARRAEIISEVESFITDNFDFDIKDFEY